MKKLYLVLLCTGALNLAKAQCPTIIGAFVNSCNTVIGADTTANTEGLNEFIAFATTAAAPASNYVLNYATTSVPANTPQNVLSGANAAAKNGTGVITSNAGCTVTYVTSGATQIPASSLVVFIPSNFTNPFDISPFCTSGTIYVVLIDITAAAPTPKWSASGTLANSPGANKRYLQVSNGANTCASGIRFYTGGWSSNADGNYVVWDAAGVPTYYNGGCNLITPPVVTPVKLVSFTAVGAGKNASIAWQTSNEQNSKSFVLERATDGVTFKTIYTTDAAGHSSSISNYAYTDANIAGGASYYRLKMVDLDGTVTYSKIAKIVSIRNGFVITNVYPTPAASQLRVTWNAPTAGNTTANVFDMTGRMLLSKQMATATGMNYYQLPVGVLPTGSYLLKLVKDGETVVKQFSKQ